MAHSLLYTHTSILYDNYPYGKDFSFTGFYQLISTKWKRVSAQTTMTKTPFIWQS